MGAGASFAPDGMGEEEAYDAVEAFGYTSKLDDDARAEIVEVLTEGQTDLDLRWAGLSKVPPEVSRLRCLADLNLSGNTLDFLPDEISALSSLNRLNLWGNSLRTLPQSFANLKSLKVLYLTQNRLKELPMNFGQLENLVDLALSNNSLEELPQSFANLERLQALYLGDNLLKTLPQRFGRLGELQKLELNMNKLRKLPASFAELPGSLTLAIVGNPLSEPPLPVARRGVNAIAAFFAADAGKGRLRQWADALSAADGASLHDAIDFDADDVDRRPEDGKDGDGDGGGDSDGGGGDTAGAVLALPGRRLTGIPVDIKALTMVTSIDLADNHLSALPDELFSLPLLRFLSLSGNKGLARSGLPASVGRATALRTLLLQEIGLDRLPVEMGGLSNDLKLEVGGNNLRKPPCVVIWQGIPAIREWFAEHAEDGPSPLPLRASSPRSRPTTDEKWTKREDFLKHAGTVYPFLVQSGRPTTAQEAHGSALAMAGNWALL